MGSDDVDKEKVFSELEALCLNVLGIPDKIGALESAESIWAKREESFRQLVSLAPQAVAVVAADGEILFANQQAAELFDEERPERVFGKWLGEVVHPEDRAAFNSDVENAQEEGGGARTSEYRFVRRDGTVVHGEIAVVRVTFREKPAVQVLIHDITDRKKVEESYKRADRNLRLLIDGISSSLLAISKAGEIIMMNAAARNCLEIEEDPVGKNLIDLVPDASGLMEDAAPEERRQLNIQLPGGRTKILGFTSLTGKDQDFRIVVFRDVTDIVQTEHQKRRAEDLALVEDMVRIFTSKQPDSDKSPEEYQSQAMRVTMNKAMQAASTDSIILLLGESGSGKDYLARFIHSHSPRADGPYFDINCAALPPNLAESELFGHEQEAFTGAHRRKRGLLELAENGTLLLNEIGDISSELQTKLLSFLDTRSFARVGGMKQISVNARLIAATNRDLEEEVKEGGFRQDLFYRLNVLSIDVPPLRERIEDIPVIARKILSRLTKELNLSRVPEIDPDALEMLSNYGWPGNIRELRNVLERALIVAKQNVIRPEDLGIKTAQAPWSFILPRFPKNRTLNEVTRDLKRALVTEALRLSDGSRKEAAKSLGISRNSLLHYVKTLNIDA